MKFTTNGAWNTPAVIQQWVKNCSADTLLAMYSANKIDEDSHLDSAQILRAILEGDDDGKKLVIAGYANLCGFSDSLKVWEIIRLSRISSAHKIALFGNARTNWYGWYNKKDKKILYHELFKPAILAAIAWRKDEAAFSELFLAIDESGRKKDFSAVSALLEDTKRKEDHAAVSAILKNPRMNREIIADFIRGRDRSLGIDEYTRLCWGTDALSIAEAPDGRKNREEPPFGFGSFSAPGEAMHLAILSTTNSRCARLKSSYFWEPVINYYANNPFRICYDDWITIPQEMKDAGEIITYETKRLSAFKNILDWAQLYFRDAPAGIGDNEKHSKNEGFERHDFESYLIILAAGILKQSKTLDGSRHC